MQVSGVVMGTKTKKTLLIIAAGMGSRYGGLKQIDPVGPNGEIIIDYSMYDAVKAGFDKIVFVIRRHFEDAFREKIGRKLDGLVETAYAYQEVDCCLDGFNLPQEREKPWGTGHAILVAKDTIQEPFAVINADDYYGCDSFGLINQQLGNMTAQNCDEYSMVGYVLKNTLSEYGSVARGVCRCDERMYLQNVTERCNISKNGSDAVYLDEAGNGHNLSGDETVSMNLWGFTPDIFGHLQRQFSEYIREHASDDKSEFYIPTAVDTLIQQQIKKVKVVKTHDTWFGVTYPQDKPIAQASIRNLIEQGIYPENLWYSIKT
jgi:UTP-glucose-1-phosphate uridylyltransferase